MDDAQLKDMVSLTNENAQPNLNELALLVRNIEPLCLSVKFFGYELARALAAALPVREGLVARRQNLASKPSTQTDLESDWAAYWCSQLKAPVIFHRKLWELSYVLQAIHDHGSLRSGARGLGFGCGREPIPSYLASRGVEITATDQPPEEMEAKGWASSRQFSECIDALYLPNLVAREQFDRHVKLRYVDMNAINDDIRGYDFCWSICALEHLGSIAKGLDFIENSLETLRPGGLAVHTTEFSFFNTGATIDNWPTVLFQKSHFMEIAKRLESKGHRVAPLDFHVGDKPLDKFIDVPPYSHDWHADMQTSWGQKDCAHLKLSIDGFPSTCFGLIITKAD